MASLGKSNAFAHFSVFLLLRIFPNVPKSPAAHSRLMSGSWKLCAKVAQAPSAKALKASCENQKNKRLKKKKKKKKKLLG